MSLKGRGWNSAWDIVLKKEVLLERDFPRVQTPHPFRQGLSNGSLPGGEVLDDGECRHQQEGDGGQPEPSFSPVGGYADHATGTGEEQGQIGIKIPVFWRKSLLRM